MWGYKEFSYEFYQPTKESGYGKKCTTSEASSNVGVLRSNQIEQPKVMATASPSHENEEEYVLLDLDDVYGQVDIPQNAPYVLSGLDTLNPTLVIDNKLKLIGEYKETIGTCFVFSES
ncbi:hypothetical protein RJ639_021659, partial [Escallonia herrerae]